jgi:hypothetical protein
MNGVLKSEKQVISIVEKFKKDNKCGMVGYQKYENFNVNMGEMNKIYPILGISNHPIDTKFAQIGILKNPTSFGSTATFTDNQFSGLYSIKLNQSSITGTVSVGDKITQTVTGGTGGVIGTAIGYVASYDTETNVVKYFRDRSLYFNSTKLDETDYKTVSSQARVLAFESSSYPIVKNVGGFSASVDTSFSGVTTSLSTGKIISLGTQFTNGLSNPEINKSSGDIIYIDNRPLVSRNSRQKEDVKIILEF